MSTVIVMSQPEDSIDRFIELFAKTGDVFGEMGTLLFRLSVKDPNALAKIRERIPSMPEAFLADLLRVGERSLHPAMLTNTCAAYMKLRSLPYSLQERAVDAGVIDLVVDVESGDTLRVPLTELTPKQAAQVISPDGIRSKDDQRVFLKRKQVIAPKILNSDPLPWLVKKDYVDIAGRCRLSRLQLIAFLGEMG